MGILPLNNLDHKKHTILQIVGAAAEVPRLRIHPYRMLLCSCMQRMKSAERKEYERLQETLARKQAEVRKLQAECAALNSPPERQDRPPAREQVYHGHPYLVAHTPISHTVD